MTRSEPLHVAIEEKAAIDGEPSGAMTPSWRSGDHSYRELSLNCVFTVIKVKEDPERELH
jgi:hypothetical protein